MVTLNKNASLIELNHEQKAIVMANYETLTLGELTALAFPSAKADGRTTEGRSIQAFLVGLGKTILTSASPRVVELTPEHKKQIAELIDGGKVKQSLEMAKLIFGPKTRQLSSEWRIVYTYMNEIAPELFGSVDKVVTEREYEPPQSIQPLIGLVNRFVNTGDNRKTYNPNTLKISETRNLRSLMSYMRIYRFSYVASTYEKQVDRDLFLSTFIRWTHNKPDLTEMEQDQMISAAAETVNVAQMEREIQDIKKYHESVMAGDEVDESTGKKKRFGMVEIEQINGVRTKHDQAKARLKQLMEALEATRATRLDNIKDRNASILNLFEAWQNDPEWRASLLNLGNQEKKEDRAEVKRLYDMDDTIALISGQTIEEGGA